jgi:hypothetical protein
VNCDDIDTVQIQMHGQFFTPSRTAFDSQGSSSKKQRRKKGFHFISPANNSTLQQETNNLIRIRANGSRAAFTGELHRFITSTKASETAVILQPRAATTERTTKEHQQQQKSFGERPLSSKRRNPNAAHKKER